MNSNIPANVAESAARAASTGTNVSEAVCVSGLVHYYGDRKALDDVSFNISEGEIFGFLGPNGSGKSTLFKILSTLIQQAGGSARIFGHDLISSPEAVRRLLGVAFQSPSLDGKLTCTENLYHHGRLYGIRGADLSSRTDEMLDRFGLASRAGDVVADLSGGLKRRLELAKTIMHKPRLLLLDEPATGLDPAARRDVWQDLKKLQSEDHTTVLLTTHLMAEADHCDRLAILSEGRIVATGTPDELKSAIGGDVIHIESTDLKKLAGEVKQRFDTEAVEVDGQLRIEHNTAHRFITELIEAFPGAIQSVRVSKPSLEDVFLHTTGHSFKDAEEIAL